MFISSPRAPSSPTTAAVDDGNLGSAQRKRPKKRGPARCWRSNKRPAGALPRRYRSISTARAVEEKFAGLLLAAAI